MAGKDLAATWREYPFGPWERYRRDLAEGFFLLVSPLPLEAGGWTWDMYGPGQAEYVALATEEYTTAEEARKGADRQVPLLASQSPALWSGRDVTWPPGRVLTPVTLAEPRPCDCCETEIAPGPAAEAPEGWFCVSCSCRIPGNVLAGGGAVPARGARSSRGLVQLPQGGRRKVR